MGKPKDLSDSLYYSICFMAGVWNPKHNISEVCLYPAWNPVPTHCMEPTCLTVTGSPNTEA